MLSTAFVSLYYFGWGLAANRLHKFAKFVNISRSAPTTDELVFVCLFGYKKTTVLWPNYQIYLSITLVYVISNSIPLPTWLLYAVLFGSSEGLCPQETSAILLCCKAGLRDTQMGFDYHKTQCCISKRPSIVNPFNICSYFIAILFV